ncbi:MAG: hypothetical protein J6A21_08645 [Lentisphaeria bacterium]|nr:hypothetical protein [Lentisphaeria bacterium]
MSTFESLVPPLELCRKIPEGKFTDSCFVRPDQVYWNPVWIRGTSHYCRMDACGIKMFPAPTLQEILAEIDAEGGYCPSCRYQANTWQLDYEEDPLDGESTLPVLVNAEDHYNPATAALKLYLELLSVPSEVHK